MVAWPDVQMRSPRKQENNYIKHNGSTAEAEELELWIWRRTSSSVITHRTHVKIRNQPKYTYFRHNNKVIFNFPVQKGKNWTTASLGFQATQRKACYESNDLFIYALLELWPIMRAQVCASKNATETAMRETDCGRIILLRVFSVWPRILSYEQNWRNIIWWSVYLWLKPCAICWIFPSLSWGRNILQNGVPVD
jgi:hypothetical protein